MLPALDSPDLQPSAPPSGQSPVASRQPPLSDRDRALLAALRDPSAIANNDPFEYAEWIERPEIQKAIAAQDDLDARRERLKAAAHRAECLEDNRLARQRLRAVLDATMDLADDAQRTDHRRAATALGRIASGPSSPLLGGGGRASRPVGAFSSSASCSTRSTEQPRPAPRTPDHSLTPVDLVGLAAAALANPTAHALAELQGLITKPGNGCPRPDLDAVAAVYDFRAAPAVAAQYETQYSNAHNAMFTLCLQRQNAPAAVFTLGMVRQERGKYRGCWMIDQLRAHHSRGPTSPNTS